MNSLAQANTSSRHRRARRAARTGCLLAALPLAVSQALAVQVTSTWIGANGSWGTAANWDPAQVPLNTANTTYGVQIGTNRSISYSIAGAREIDQLALDLGSALNFSSPSLTQPTSLNVLGQALIAGSISADRASFTATGAGTALLGNTITVGASNGGVVRLGGSSYSFKGYNGRNVLNATGAGSVIDMASVQAIDGGAAAVNFAYTNSIVAADRGTINLSGARTLTASSTSAGTLALSATGGGNINLGSLQEVSGVTLDSGRITFTADSGSFALGAIRVLNQSAVSLANGSTMTLGGSASSASITASTFSASGASRLNGATLVGEYNGRAFTGGTLIGAAGANTLIDLSGLQKIDSGSSANFAFANRVAAADQAVIDLSGVRTLVAPAISGGTLAFSAINGASIRLNGLQDVSGLTVETGRTTFTADAGTFTLGALRSANRMDVGLQNGSTLTVGGFAGNTSLVNSTIGVSGGSVFDGATLLGDYAVRGYTGGTVLSAAGPGSLLRLSGLRSLDAGASANFAFTTGVSAADLGVVDLSGVRTLVAPAINGGTLGFTTITGGTVRLDNVQTISGLTVDTGATAFTGDNGRFVLGGVLTANRMSVNLQNGSTMVIGGNTTPAQVTNSTFFASGGSRLSGASWVGEYSARSAVGGTIVAANGLGTVLDLSGLRSFTSGAAANFTFATSVASSDRALLDLSGLNTIVSPASSGGTLAFNANTGATLRLTSLQAVDTATGGQVAFNAASAGTIAMRGFNAGNGVRFSLVDAGSRLQVTGTLALGAGSTMSAGAGTVIEVAGSYSFAQTVEAGMNLDFARLVFGGGANQTLEVGGRRLATLANGSAVTGNFAVGQLQVGQDAATVLTLADAIDNGNRSGPEVLYLNGSGTALNGLRILNGSTLVLGGVDLYTTEAGAWVRINDRFVNGLTLIAYDQGFISLTPVPEPATWGLMGMGLACVAWRKSRARREAGADGQ